MKGRPIRSVGTALATALALGVAQAGAAPGLNAGNFVDVGDAVVDMLDNSRQPLSSMRVGSFVDPMPGNAAAPGHESELSCPGAGHVTSSVLDKDDSGDLSPSDRVVNTFDACAVGGSVLSGRGEFRVASHRFDGYAEITELEFRFTGLGTDEMRWTGAAHVALRTNVATGTDHYIVTYRDLVVTQGQHHTRWNFGLDLVRPPIGSQVASVEGTISTRDMLLRLRQDEPLVISSNGHPLSGQLSAADLHGARLEIEAGSLRYAYRLYRAGNRGELPDATSQSKPYGER